MTSQYYRALKQFTKSLSNLDAIMDKAQKHADAKKFDASNFCTERLIADMLPFTKQIQIATDVVKGAIGSFTGKEMPVWEDNEKTFDECRQRVRKCLALLEGAKEADFAALKPDAAVKLRQPGKGMTADDMLWERVIPNFFFHCTTAYALLRRSGVDIGKGDFLGNLRTFDL